MSQRIYIGTDGSKKYIKIGITDDVERRQKEIRRMNPTFRMLYSWKPSQATACEAERYFHSCFAEKRVFGEWFDLSIDDILMMTNGRGKYRLMFILGRRQ